MGRRQGVHSAKGHGLVLAAALLSACGGGSSDNTKTDGGTDAGGGGSFYAVATTLMANTATATSLLFTTPSLAAGATVDESKGIPVADVVSLYGIEGSGVVYSTAAMSANVTEYNIDTSGTITPGRTLSFASFGLSGGYSTRAIAMVSATKAYLLDDTSLQAISFDPSTMTVGKAIDLSGMALTNYGASFSYSIPVRNNGGQIVVTAYYYDQTFSQTVANTAVALIDTAADTATIVKDTRCGDFSTVATAANGDLYFASDTYATSINLVGGATMAPPGCMLRMKSGENTFDSSFFVQIKDLTGVPGGGAVPGTGNSIWVRGYDATIAPITSTTSATDVLGAPAWKWFQVDTTNPTAMATASTFAPSAGELKYFIVGGHALVDNGSADFMSTTEVDLTATGAPVGGAVINGQTAGIVKAR